LAGFLGELPRLRRVLWTDIDAAYEGDPAAKSYEEIILAYPALEAIAIYRMAHLLYEKVPLVPRIMTEWAHSRTGIDIHPGAKIGSHFFYRSRDRCGRRRNVGNRCACEVVSWRHARRAQFSEG